MLPGLRRDPAGRGGGVPGGGAPALPALGVDAGGGRIDRGPRRRGRPRRRSRPDLHGTAAALGGLPGRQHQPHRLAPRRPPSSPAAGPRPPRTSARPAPPRSRRRTTPRAVVRGCGLPVVDLQAVGVRAARCPAASRRCRAPRTDSRGADETTLPAIRRTRRRAGGRGHRQRRGPRVARRRRAGRARGSRRPARTTTATGAAVRQPRAGDVDPVQQVVGQQHVRDVVERRADQRRERLVVEVGDPDDVADRGRRARSRVAARHGGPSGRCG